MSTREIFTSAVFQVALLLFTGAVTVTLSYLNAKGQKKLTLLILSVAAWVSSVTVILTGILFILLEQPIASDSVIMPTQVTSPSPNITTFVPVLSVSETNDISSVTPSFVIGTEIPPPTVTLASTLQNSIEMATNLVPTFTSTATVTITNTPTVTATYTVTPSTTITLTPTLTSTPTATASSVPTVTPQPTLSGIGSTFGDSSFGVTLTDYYFRSNSHPEPAAVSFSLRFTNNTSQPIEVVINTWTIRGEDNLGNQYGEYYASGRRACWDLIIGECIGSVPDQEVFENYGFTVPTNSTYSETFYLHRVGILQDTVSRVDFRTDYIDLVIPSIAFRIESVQEIRAEWRLIRK